MPSKRKREPKEDAGDKPVYMVVEHYFEGPAFSILKARGGTRRTPVTIPLHRAKRGMSFAAVESRWIVGVGGNHTNPVTIYDLATRRELGGPWLWENKLEPVLIPLRGKLYVLSRRPAIYRGLDFPPWFERFSFTDGCPPRSSSTTEELPPPPIFPCRINPLEYLDPPEVRVAAYAAVGSHILLSVEQDKGTCAFDVDRQVWEMVHDKNLPFLGQAVPLGNHLFVARSKEKDGAAAVYFMDVFPATDTATGKSELSILELPLVVPKGRNFPGQLLCASGKGSFSRFHVRFVDPGGKNAEWEKPCVVHRTYSLVKGDDTETNAELVKQQRQVYKLLDPSCLLAHPAPVVAAFTMDAE